MFGSPAAIALMERDPSLTLEGARGLLTQFRDLEAEGERTAPRNLLVEDADV